ncbi:MAG: hypothetical protein ACKV2U_26085 [Bryobacteraceae bacterium]
MLGSEIRADYFAELAGTYLFRQRSATWATLFLASGSVASILVSQVSVELRLLIAIATMAVSLYSAVIHNQKLAVDAADLHAKWNRLSMDYEKLWENVYTDGAVPKLDALTDRSDELSKSRTLFPNKPKAMLRWQKHVEDHRFHHVAP